MCIRKIRKTLDDDPQAPTYIHTAHRRGYRFVAPVALVDAAAPAVPVPKPAAGDAGASSPRPLGAALAGVATPPTTHYAQSGDVSIAYQLLGDGPIDLVFVMGWVSHLDYVWREPSSARFLTRLASFSRLILFDKRGTGLSDRVSDLPTLEQRMHDVRAVMEAVGSTRAALLGVSEGGPLCSLFATTYPDRTLALVMIGTYAKRLWAADYPWAPTRAEREHFFEEIRHSWGGPVGIEARAPSKLNDPAFREWWATYLRMGASPGAALTLTRMNTEIDIRQVLPAVRVPTLVLHRTDDMCLKVEEGRLWAIRTRCSTRTLLNRRYHDLDADRVLATVLCARVDALPGEAAVDGHFDVHARREIEWFRGRAIEHDDTSVTAAFDGPARAIRCAASMAASAARFGRSVRVGLHTGECDMQDGRLGGPAVDITRALGALAAPGEVLVSRTVKDLVAGSGQSFLDRGMHKLGDDQHRWRVFAARVRHDALRR